MFSILCFCFVYFIYYKRICDFRANNEFVEQKDVQKDQFVIGVNLINIFWNKMSRALFFQYITLHINGPIILRVEFRKHKSKQT